MIKPDMIPDEVWTQVALRLESAGCIVPNSVAKLVAAEVINAWPGMQIVEERADAWGVYLEIAPLPKENTNAES